MRKLLAALAVTSVSMLGSLVPAYARANEAPVCPQMSEYHYGGQPYEDWAVYNIGSWCTDADGDPVTLVSIDFVGNPWWWYGPDSILLDRAPYGPTDVVFTVTDGNGNYTQGTYTLYRS